MGILHSLLAQGHLLSESRLAPSRTHTDRVADTVRKIFEIHREKSYVGFDRFLGNGQIVTYCCFVNPFDPTRPSAEDIASRFSFIFSVLLLDILFYAGEIAQNVVYVKSHAPCVLNTRTSTPVP